MNNANGFQISLKWKSRDERGLKSAWNVSLCLLLRSIEKSGGRNT